MVSRNCDIMGRVLKPKLESPHQIRNIMFEILCHVYHFSFLSLGDSFTGLKARFHTGKSTIHDVVIETCQAIWDVLKDEILPVPTPEH